MGLETGDLAGDDTQTAGDEALGNIGTPGIGDIESPHGDMQRFILGLDDGDNDWASMILLAGILIGGTSNFLGRIANLDCIGNTFLGLAVGDIIGLFVGDSAVKVSELGAELRIAGGSAATPTSVSDESKEGIVVEFNMVLPGSVEDSPGGSLRVIVGSFSVTTGAPESDSIDELVRSGCFSSTDGGLFESGGLSCAGSSID